MGGDNLYQYAPNPMGWIDPLGLAGKRWEIGRYADVKGSGYEGHEFTRHKVLKEMGCGDERNASDSVHNLEASLAKKHLSVGRNEFQTNVDGTPTKRQRNNSAN